MKVSSVGVAPMSKIKHSRQRKYVVCVRKEKY